MVILSNGTMLFSRELFEGCLEPLIDNLTAYNIRQSSLTGSDIMMQSPGVELV